MGFIIFGGYILGKLSKVFLVAAMLVGFQTLVTTHVTMAKDLSADECPVKMTGKLATGIGETFCKRFTTSSNTGHYYINNTMWAGKKQFARFAFQPIKSYQYWTKAPAADKKRIHMWDELKDVNLDKVQQIDCQAYSCFTFKVPDENKGHCFWFSNNAKQGDKFADGSKATGIISGYTCKSEKNKPFKSSEAIDFTRDILAK